MKINEIISPELLERHYRRRQITRRPLAHRSVITNDIQPLIKKPTVPNTQTTGLNPKIDIMNGPEHKLNNRNIRPDITDREIQISMQSRNNIRKTL